MTKTNWMRALCLLFVACLCAGCAVWPGNHESSLPASGLASEDSQNRADSGGEDLLDMWMLEDYVNTVNEKNLTDMVYSINSALETYAHDFDVSLDTLPAAQEYAAAFLGHAWHPVDFWQFQMLSAEYTLAYPEAIQNGPDFAIAFTYQDPTTTSVLLYLGQTNCYLEVNGKIDYAHCPSVVNRLSRKNRLDTLDECIATGELAIDILERECVDNAGLFSGLFAQLYPNIAEQNVFPKFVSARYDEGSSAQNQPGYFVDSGILYLIDRDGNEYGFRMSGIHKEITYNGTIVYYRRFIT